MIERLVKPGRSIKIRFNKLEDEHKSLRGSIRIAVTQMIDQKDSTMGPWSLLKRLGVHFGIMKRREIRYLLEALRELDKLYAVIKDLSNLSKLFEDVWTNTTAINTNLDNMAEIFQRRRDSPYETESKGQKQFVSLVK